MVAVLVEAKRQSSRKDRDRYPAKIKSKNQGRTGILGCSKSSAIAAQHLAANQKLRFDPGIPQHRDALPVLAEPEAFPGYFRYRQDLYNAVESPAFSVGGRI